MPSRRGEPMGEENNNTDNNKTESNVDNRIYLGLVIGIGILLVFFGLDETMPKPQPALTEWTEWAAKYVALVIAAQKIWKVSDKLIARIG